MKQFVKGIIYGHKQSRRAKQHKQGKFLDSVAESYGVNLLECINNGMIF